MVLLEHGAKFGPLIAGPEGSLLFEVYLGDSQPVPADPEGFLKLLESMGIEPLPHPVYEYPPDRAYPRLPRGRPLQKPWRGGAGAHKGRPYGRDGFPRSRE